MRRFAELTVSILCLGLAAFSAFAVWSRAGLEAENASLKRSVRVLQDHAAQVRLARDVERARVAGMAARNADLAAALAIIQKGGIPDATLDPDLAALVNRMQSGN